MILIGEINARNKNHKMQGWYTTYIKVRTSGKMTFVRICQGCGCGWQEWGGQGRGQSLKLLKQIVTIGVVFYSDYNFSGRNLTFFICSWYFVISKLVSMDLNNNNNTNPFKCLLMYKILF